MNQRLLIAAGTILIVFAFLVGNKFTAFDFGRTSNESFAPVKTNTVLIAGTTEKFEFLSKQTSNSCGLQAEVLMSYDDKKYLQGSCCSSMVLHRYSEQVEGLKKYANISQIPQDPYDISASQAKELLGYKNSIKLTANQQEIYDQAMKLSHEGGPCCCKCWRWDAFEGQAKYLITQHGFSAEQIAQVWDLEDGCGGDAHQHT